MNSKVTLKMVTEGEGDGRKRIEEHVEEWDNEALKTGEDGFWGKVQEWRKRVDAKGVEGSVSSDPSKV